MLSLAWKLFSLGFASLRISFPFIKAEWACLRKVDFERSEKDE